MRKIWICCLLAIVPLTLVRAQRPRSSSAKALPNAPERRDARELYTPLVAANNRFAVKFFKAAYAHSPRENVLTAPASMSYSFALLLNGAQGEGRDQIADLFNLKGLSIAQINEGNAALRDLRKSYVLGKSERRFGPLTDPDGRSFQPYTLAGALWVRKGNFTHAFLERNRESYGYTVFPRRPTVSEVNRWASSTTHGKVNKVVDDLKDDGFALATLVHFKSKWVIPFLPSDTHPADFTLLSGEKKQVQMMPRHDPDFIYLKGPHFQAVRLNFFDAAMFIVLPDEDSSLQAFVDTLNPDIWQSWNSQFGPHEGYLELPRFEIKSERNSKEVLQEMRLTLPFSDFSTFIPMVGLPGGAKLTRVQESADMKVDETGAEIIFTGVVGGVPGGVCGNCPPPPPPFHMIVNRPFFFWIVDTRTDQVLHMGSVVEP